MMQEITSVAALRVRLATERRAGRRIGLVPTMGYLHDGHLALVDAIRHDCDLIVMSLFVNPLQFAPGEDFDRYPRDLQRDRELAAARGVDILFVPPVSEMYDADSDLQIAAGSVAARWEGAVRPGHFDGVLTVVAKLFNIVAPEVACFGQKDIQQVTLIRRMIREFDYPVRLLVAPTVREVDGLAMSSRNVYLAPADRDAALVLSRALRQAEAAWRAGVSDAPALRDTIEAVLSAVPGVTPDYIMVAEPEGLMPIDHVTSGTVIALAARVGRTRLIDNVILGGDPPIAHAG